jgi:hypothetical protein
VSSPHLRPKTRFLLLWGNLPDERMGRSFTTAAGSRHHSHSRVRVPRDSWPYFTVSDSRLSQIEGPGPRIYIPRNSVVGLYPQALGSLFVISYDSQGYGRGNLLTFTLYCIENTASKSSSIVACVSVAAYTCLSSRYQAMAVFFSHHVIILKSIVYTKSIN